MSDFGEMTRVRTTKPHRCEWCGEEIPAHTHCGNYRGIFQDSWQNWYMHPECEKVYSLDRDVQDDGFMPYENPRPKQAGLQGANTNVEPLGNPVSVNGELRYGYRDDPKSW